jgi:hypothetical protein
MAQPLKPGKKSVQLKTPVPGSRIRREPPPAEKPADSARHLWWSSSEGEITIAIIGIVLFAIAIDLVVVAVSAYTGKDSAISKPMVIEVHDAS